MTDLEPRLRAFFDRGTARPLAPGDDPGAVRGRIDGTPAIAFGGGRDAVKAIDAAVRERVPVVGFWDTSAAGLEPVFAAVVRASGRVPQISVAPEPLEGAAAYAAALADVVTGDDQSARRLVGLLGSPGRFSPDDVAPRPVSAADLLDEPGVELDPSRAPAVATTLGRFAGRTVGVVASSGYLEPTGARKAARFVRMCDSLAVPLIVVVDSPGAAPCGPELPRAFAEAVVPRVTLVTREARGDAFLIMNSSALGATAVVAWPGAETDGPVDAVIAPADTRRRLAEALAAAPQ